MAKKKTSVDLLSTLAETHKHLLTPIEEYVAKAPVENKRELSDIRLSYSSYTTIKSCESRYWHYKVNNTPVDTDYSDEKKSLILGKAFHSILEFTKHTSTGLGDAIKHVKEGIGDDDMALVVAMVKVYLRFRESHKQYSKLNPVGIEVEISNEKFMGFVDVVLADENGNWYIGDLKTTARQSETLKSRLQMDAQLHLYSSQAEQIAEKLNLEKNKFMGALYITTNKTTTKRKDNEKLSDYVDRLTGAIETRVYVVPMDKAKTDWVTSDFISYHEKTNQLRSGKVPEKNYSQCENYFTPCPYFSKCHGHNFTDADLEIWSSDG
jgi:hypothetical protein